MDLFTNPLVFSVLTIIVGLLIIIFPRILNYAVGIYLLIIGILGLISHYK